MSDPRLPVPQLHILIDERTEWHFTRFNGTWNTESSFLTYMEKSGFYEGRAMWTNDPSAWFSFEFNGTSFSFVGNVGPSQHPNPDVQRVVDIQIDGGHPTRADYPCCGYTTWYQSPTLPDGLHKVRASTVGPAEVDFAIIRAGESTNIIQQIIFMDNEDPSIRYSGNWTRRTSLRSSDGSLTNTEAGFPVNGSSHQTSTVGDSFAFGFAGNRVAVYGIFDWLSTGMLSLSFSIDGESPDVQTFRSQKFALQNGYQLYGEALNYVLYSQMELKDGPHTMVVTLVRCESQVFSFDYITYEASFDSFTSMPAVTAPVLSPSALGTSVRNSEGQTNQNLNIGLISGLSIGGLALICASVLLSMWLRQRKRSRTQDQQSKSETLFVEDIIIPFPKEPKAERGPGSLRGDSPGYVAEGSNATSSAARNHLSTSITGTARRIDEALPYSPFLDPPTHLGTAAALKQERAEAVVITTSRRLDELTSGHRSTAVSEPAEPAHSESSGLRPISAVAPAALPDAAIRVETATATSPEGPLLTLHTTEPPPAYEGVQISQA